MASFLTAFRKLIPKFLTEDEGELVQGSLAVVKSHFVERLRQGLYAKFPAHGPPDALAYIGRDRRIVRGINEPASSYRVRLLRWLSDHRVRGNPFALHDQLRAYLQTDVMIRTVDRRGNWFTTAADGTRSVELDSGTWDWDAEDASSWSRFWVIIYPTAVGPWAVSGNWGDAGLWGGGVWGAANKTIGTTATQEQVASVRQIIRDWQPDGTRCEWVIVAFDPASFDPATPDPDGTWGLWGKVDGAGNYVPARLRTARYWKGSVS